MAWRGTAIAILAAAVLIAGCASSALPIQATLQPAPMTAFLEYVGKAGAHFSGALREAGTMSAEDALATVRGQRGRRAVFDTNVPLSNPVYGIVTCPDPATCRDAFSVQDGGSALRVWVVSSLAQTGPDAGRWIALNAVTGFYAVGGPD